MIDIAQLLIDTGRSPAPSLLPILRSRLVGQLLALLAIDDERWWPVEEIAARTGGAHPTLTRELRRLQQVGLVETEEVGRSKRIRGNTANPLHRPDRDEVHDAARRTEARLGQ